MPGKHSCECDDASSWPLHLGLVCTTPIRAVHAGRLSVLALLTSKRPRASGWLTFRLRHWKWRRTPRLLL